jgi:hypothetical protein
MNGKAEIKVVERPARGHAIAHASWKADIVHFLPETALFRAGVILCVRYVTVSFVKSKRYLSGN